LRVGSADGRDASAAACCRALVRRVVVAATGCEPSGATDRLVSGDSVAVLHTELAVET